MNPKMEKDPICGMEVDAKTAIKQDLVIEKNDIKYYFCSKKCMKEFQSKKWYGGKTISYALSVLLVVVAVTVFLTGFMLPFMGIVFGILAFLKFLDLKGFATMFAQYDLIAAKSKTYAKVYPFIEAGLSLMYLFVWQVNIAASITVVVMGIGSIGVAKNMLSKNKVRCACLGTKIKVPLTTFTLVEDLVMATMGLMILI